MSQLFSDITTITSVAGLGHKEDNGKNQYMGFIAEDVPELVATSDRKGINAMDVIAVLTKALQEQQNTISVLTEKVKRLEIVRS